MYTNPRLTEDTTLLRTAIEEVLTHAKAPMTAVEVSQHPVVASLGLEVGRVRAELRALYLRKKKLFPIARIGHYGHGNTQFAYYHPEVVQPLSTPVRPAKSTPVRPAKVNDVYPNPEPEKFEFNPVELEALKPTTESAPLTAPEESKAVTTEARRITLEVAGVTIRIELTQ